MSFFPSSQTNNIPDLRSFHFAFVEFVSQIVKYYDDLTNTDVDFCREMQKAEVVYGFSEKELTNLNSENETEALISVYFDQDNLSDISLPHFKGRHFAEQFRLPYFIYIRTLKINEATTFAESNEYMRISKMFSILEKAVANDDFTLSITPNSIVYNDVIQHSLSDKTVTINSGSNSIIERFSIVSESYNNRQYAVGRSSFLIHFTQNNL
jgi:hypothetical protein